MAEDIITLRPRQETTARCNNDKCTKSMNLKKMTIKTWKNGWYLGEQFFYCKHCGNYTTVKRKLNPKKKKYWEKVLVKI